MAPAPTASPDYGQGQADAQAYCASISNPDRRNHCIAALQQGPSAFFSWSSYDRAEATNLPQSSSSQPAQTSASPTGSTSGGVYSETNTPGLYTPGSTTAAGSSNTNGAYGGGYGQYPQGDNHDGMPHYLMAASVIIPLIILGFIIAAIVTIVKHKRKQRRLRAAAAPEMKDLNRSRPQVESAYIRPPSSEPPSSATTAAPAPSLPPTNRESQPVILSSTMDGAYFTGIDTADHISLADVRSQTSQDPFDHGDEPPPPYRPRSVPPISRETSVRTAYRNSVSRNPSQRTYRNDPLVSNGLMGPMRMSQDVRSPFDDPDEDAISEISTIREVPTRQGDQLSVVSDLSYQEEPVVGRSAI
jgi:hypothetical protein